MDMYRMFINRDLPWPERACSSKVPYETRHEALGVARDARRTDGSLRPYHCRLGDHWHLGHRRRLTFTAAGTAHGRGERRGAVVELDWLDLEWWEGTTLGHLRFPPGLRLVATR
jgi:hypothetical protein